MITLRNTALCRAVWSGRRPDVRREEFERQVEEQEAGTRNTSATGGCGW